MNRTQTSEPRWPAALSGLAAIALYWAVPESLTPGPTWITVSFALIALLAAIGAGRFGFKDLNHALSLVFLSLLTGALIWSLATLIAGLPGKKQPPLELLRSAVCLWLSNILIFAAWYWRLDAGGPNRRDRKDVHRDGAFLFPQMALPNPTPAQAAWKPQFPDYLFLAFNTSTAFSPTDVPVLSRWAKLLMMTQSSISLSALAILAARAVNIL